MNAWKILQNIGLKFARPMEDDDICHYGIKRRSGRYPWGSGDNPYQRSGDFLARYEELKNNGLKETEIAKEMGFVDSKTGKTQTTKLRTQVSLAKEERRSLKVATAKGLRDKGYSLNQIAEEMGLPGDSSVRTLLNQGSEAKMNLSRKTAEVLKQCVDEKGMIDVGEGVERSLGVSKEKMKEAIYILEREGYVQYGGRVPQTTNPGKYTTLSVLCKPGTEHKDIYDFEKIGSVDDDYISYDGGESFRKSFEYPSSMSSSRLKIRYNEEGGIDKDGVIEIRRGVQDLDLGTNTHYAQVRIMVDGDRYLKGMAVYSDGKDMPDGVDVIFNTNKKQGTDVRDVLKKVKEDPSNPFGALIKEKGGQSYYDDPDGKYTDPLTGKKQSLSLINKTREEGDWGEWSKNLPSQFLGKQNKELIEKQLNLSLQDKKAEFDEICSLTNPTVKRQLLQSFSDDCDSASVHLKAAALPRQKYQVILPLTSISENEVYAPNYSDGETLALVRFPHGGTFEIPIVKVNNRIAEGKSTIGTTPLDAIGINSKVAERLSGADFDGDTVLCIPCNSSKSKVRITSTPSLKGLKDFDPKLEYGSDNSTKDADGTEHYFREGKEFKVMKNTQTEMGKVSNLITDMTLKGATTDELAQAVRHSMVVIDAEKHHLDYQQSYLDNNIAGLKKKYQGTIDPETGNYHEGAATLLSRAKSTERVLKRKGSPQIDKETGEVSYKEVKEEYVDKNGKTQYRMQESTKMAETKDAHKLSSGTTKEEIYADYANSLKSLANEARRVMVNTPRLAYSPSAKETYSEEVKSLDSKLNLSLQNAPKERRAQLLANATVKAKVQDNPELKSAENKTQLKKIKQQALVSARESVGAKRVTVDISDKEWEAIQAGAISDNKLTQILAHTDVDKLRERATPRTKTELSASKINQMAALRSSGYTTAEIAERLGVSASTVSKYLSGKR